MKTFPSFDYSNMLSRAVGRFGASPSELRSLGKRLNTAKRAVIALTQNGEQGWLDIPENTAMVRRIRDLVSHKKAFQACLVIGIGGSDLGARALYRALGGDAKGMELVFAGANTDPDELYRTIKGLDLKRTLINVISKSGDTVEPMTTFLVVRDALVKVVGRKNYSEHIVATTDEFTGSLRAMAIREKYATLPVPANVGGRFSVLSDVGLFPIQCAGIDIREILTGAANERDRFLKEQPGKNTPILYAGLNYLAYMKRGQNIQVLMPYAEALREFGLWYRQIVAESLGKRKNRKGRTVNVGPTPIASLGATDQHSQIQLYMEGPRDKIITFIEVNRFRRDVRVPRSAREIQSLSHLSGLSMQRIVHAEREATAKALAAEKRPNATIHIPGITPESLGALLMFFEISTAVSGELYDINAYDQPGVDAGKKTMHQILTS